MSHVTRSVSFDAGVQNVVDGILADVAARGDEAVLDYTEKFQGCRPEAFEVSSEEIDTAFAAADPGFRSVLEEAYENIREFHRHEADKSFFYEQGDGVILGQRVTPLERVMLYVPGGKAAYPSSLLMNVAPAKVAGVSEVYVTTPCDAEGKVSEHVLVAAKVAGVDRVFKFGGAQAIAAFAFGTERVPKVDKITGPGNKYVALAKKQVFGHVSIDSIAGPSEVVVIADRTADPEFVVMDMFAQAEHDPDAAAVCITDSVEVAVKVKELAEAMVGKMVRAEVIRQALASNGAVVVTKDMATACEVSNRIAPEHLELHVAEPWSVLPSIRHAGAVFMGSYSCETIGDYFAGPNHTLPTNGTARFFSPLSVRDFVKYTSIISYSAGELRKTGERIAAFADHEGLQAHAEAVRARLRKV
ncbi:MULTISPECIES: histidinol dehydrogenase [Prosthecochloris]